MFIMINHSHLLILTACRILSGFGKSVIRKVVCSLMAAIATRAVVSVEFKALAIHQSHYISP